MVVLFLLAFGVASVGERPARSVSAARLAIERDRFEPGDPWNAGARHDDRSARTSQATPSTGRLRVTAVGTDAQLPVRGVLDLTVEGGADLARLMLAPAGGCELSLGELRRVREAVRRGELRASLTLDSNGERRNGRVDVVEHGWPDLELRVRF